MGRMAQAVSDATQAIRELEASVEPAMRRVAAAQRVYQDSLERALKAMKEIEL